MPRAGGYDPHRRWRCPPADARIEDAGPLDLDARLDDVAHRQMRTDSAGRAIADWRWRCAGLPAPAPTRLAVHLEAAMVIAGARPKATP